MSTDTRHLEGAYAKRYDKISKDVDKIYADIIHSLSGLPYVPTVYVVPFVISKKIKVSNGGRTGTLVRYFYNLTHPDPENFERMAVFTTIEFLEKWPKYIRAGLGHELGHVVAEKGKVEPSAEDILTGINPVAMIKKQEARKDSAVALFPKDLQDLIKEWEALSDQKATNLELRRKAWVIDWEVFLDMAFDKKRDEYDKFVERKMNKAMGWTKEPV